MLLNSLKNTALVSCDLVHVHSACICWYIVQPVMAQMFYHALLSMWLVRLYLAAKPKTKYVGKKRRMCIQSKKKKDRQTVKTIKAGSNFPVKPIVQVLESKNGHIILIKVFCNKAKRCVFSVCFTAYCKINGWSHNVSQFHGPALMRHIGYASFFKLITIFFNTIFARTQRMRWSLFPFQKQKSGTNLHCFMLRSVTVF